MIPVNTVASYKHNYPQVTFSGMPVINKLADHSNKCGKHLLNSQSWRTLFLFTKQTKQTNRTYFIIKHSILQN